MTFPTDPLEASSLLVRRAAVAAFGDTLAEVDPQVRRSDRADLQADLALGLAKKLGKPPRAIAEAIKEKLELGTVIASVELAGPGFLNLTLSTAWLAEAAARAIEDERLQSPKSPSPERVVIDYSAPNVAKEMHVGHLRSTVLGDALARLLEWRGHTVIRQNHIGDWGTPFGMLIEHMLDLGEDAAASELAVGELSLFYKAARVKFDADPAFAERSRKRVVSLQSGDPDTLGHWKKLVDLSKSYFESVYEKLGVTLRPTDVAGESSYNALLTPLSQELEANGKAAVNEGALCLFPTGFVGKDKSPLPLIVRKSDGGYGYATTDLAAIRYRLNDLRATRLLYVIGAPQQQHLAMIFQAAKDLGWLAPPARAEHVSFGSVLGADKRMYKTRSGDTVRLVDLIDAARDRALEVLTEKLPDLAEDERKELSRPIGIGAIKWADLAADRVKDYVFDIDRMVSFDGNSAGYVQYAHARVRAVFRKAGEGARPGAVTRDLAPEERTLVFRLLAFGSVVAKVESTLEPHHLVGYLHELATTFSSFYDKCPILKAEPEIMASRLALAQLTSRTLARGLSLLGIEAPERM